MSLEYFVEKFESVSRKVIECWKQINGLSNGNLEEKKTERNATVDA